MEDDRRISNQRMSISLERQIINKNNVKDEAVYTKLLTSNEIENLNEIAIKLSNHNVSYLETSLVKSNLPKEINEQALHLHNRLNEIVGSIIVDCDLSSGREPMLFSLEDRNVNEIKKLLARNSSFDNFKHNLRQYHWAPRCNVVWRQNTVAYRCQTCGLNSCMSLCAECFENADHEGHDYSRFFSTVGGCCDCGNVDVLLPNGFCKFHREDASRDIIKPPMKDLIMSKYIIIKLLTRLLVSLRRWLMFKECFISCSNKEGYTSTLFITATNTAINNGILPLINLLHELSEAGSLITDIIIELLLDPDFYRELCSDNIEQTFNNPERVVEAPDWRLNSQLQKDIATLKNLRWIREVCHDCHPLEVECILDELIIYLIRIAYPQELIDLLLNLLYDTNYKERFAKKFFSYYPYTTAMVAELLNEVPIGSSEGSKIAERIVHISVQICSGANICTWLQQNINIINCVLQSSVMMSLIGSRSTQINHSENRFYCTTPMENSKNVEISRGWLNVSVDENPFFIKNADLFVLTDTQNLLVHQNIAKNLFLEFNLVEKYIRNIEFYQGMGVEWRIISGDHRVNDWTSNAQKCYNVEFEACSLPMHNLIQHITTKEDCKYFYEMLIDALIRWFSCIHLDESPVDTHTPPFASTFHLPLHRHLANLLFHMQSLGDTCTEYINKIKSNEELLRKLILHPMRIHAIRSEFYAGMWTRNGQGMRTAVSHYCKPTITFSFQSADLMLIRFAASNVNQEFLLNCLLKTFHIDECLEYPDDIDELEHDNDNKFITRRNWVSHLIDGALRLLLDLIIGRRDTEPDSDDLLKEEMIALLARQSLPYSHIKAIIPTRGNISFDLQMAVFDRMIEQVANFVEPDQNNSLQHGRYDLKEEMYQTKVCPVFSRLRSFGIVDYSEFTNKMEQKDRDKCNPPLPSTVPPWLPFRMYDFDTLYLNRFENLKAVPALLTQPTFFVLCYKILNKINTTNYMHSTILQQIIYLMTLSIQFIKSKLFDECITKLYHPNEYIFPAFLDDTFHSIYSKTIKNNPDPKKIIKDMFLLKYPPTGESIFSILIELFVKLVKRQKQELTENEALIELKNYIGNDEINQERIYGGGAQYIGRLLNNLFSLDENIGPEIREFLNKTENEQETSMEVDLTINQSTSNDASLNEKKAKLKKKKENLIKQMQKKGAAMMKHHMMSEGITQAEMDRLDTKTNESQKYECPICGETSDHSLANPIGIFVNTRPNNVVLNSVNEKTAVTELMDLAPEAKFSSAGYSKEVDDDKCLKTKKVVKTKRKWFIERDNNYLEAFNKNEDVGQKYLKLIRFRQGIEVRTCGHFAHLQCFKSYLNSLTNTPIIRIDFSMSCPYCRSPVNSILPLKMEYGREKIRADFDIQQIEANYNEIYKLYKERLYDPRPLFIGNEEMKMLNKEYRESFEAFEDIAYRQLINGQLDPGVDRTFIEGTFKGFDARMGFIQSNIERMIMLISLDLPFPSFSKHPFIEHILTGALTLSMKHEEVIIENLWKDLLNAAIGKADSLTNKEIYHPMLLCDVQSLYLKCAVVCLGDERFVDNDRINYAKLIYRILLNLCLTKAVQNTIIKSKDSRIVKEFLQTAKFSQDTIIERCLQKVLDVSRDLFVDVVDRLESEFSYNDKEDMNSVDEMIQFTVKHAEMISTYFTKFVIVLIHGVFKEEINDITKMHFRDGVFDNLYHLIYPNNTGESIQNVAISSRFYMNRFLRTVNVFNSRIISNTLINENFAWKYRSILKLSKLYDKMFSAFFGQKCTNCGREPKHQIICLLCGSLMCLHRCNRINDAVDENQTLIERHTLQCGAGCCCYLSLNSTMIIINYYRHFVLWGTVYLDVHGEEDRNLYRGKPLYLSENRMKQLSKCWYIQDLDRHGHLRWYTLDNLSIALRQCHQI